MLRNPAQNNEFACSIASASITATTTGNYVDILGADRVLIQIPVGVVSTADASNYITFTVTDGTTTTAGDAVATTQYIAADSWDMTINATTEGSAMYAFEFIPTPGKRYIKVVGTETGTTSAIYGAYVTFSKIHQPAS